MVTVATGVSMFTTADLQRFYQADATNLPHPITVVEIARNSTLSKQSIAFLN
jgi:hypothetical protein